ncbi:MAG TPA: hemerythrin domain-containing protein [Rhizomicrobium sp.]|nr:hemerythrin domain-containing protein [Rhizomicrobium sp.]
MTLSGNTRRHIFSQATLGIAAALPLSACSGSDDKDVGAVEDLMREHGVLRRVLLVYAESIAKLRSDAASLDASALGKAAKLFHDFGEEYHERKLEEAYIFPKVKQAGGAAAGMVDILLAQHRRGRDITQYVIGVTQKGRLGAGDAEPLAHAFETFALMYENHTAREDTVIFPAWKDALSSGELEELGDKFEDIEKAQFGGDGFEDAVKQIGAIEQALGFADLAQFTAPPPPG